MQRFHPFSLLDAENANAMHTTRTPLARFPLPFVCHSSWCGGPDEYPPDCGHSWISLPGNGSREDLCSEEATLCTLDDLLVDADGWMVHDDGAGLVVDLGVDAGVADQVDDPLLTLVLAEAEAGREVPGKMMISSGSLRDLSTGETYLMSMRW